MLRGLLLVSTLLITLPAAPASGEQVELSLEDCLDRLDDRLPLLQASIYDLKASEARLDRARHAWVPALWVKSLFTLIPERTTNLSKDGEPVSQDQDNTDVLSYAPYTHTSMNTVLPLYTFGKLDNVEKLASIGVEADRQRLFKTRAEVVHLTRKAYYGLQLARFVVSSTADGLSKLEKAEEKLRDRLEDEDDDEADDKDLFKLGYFKAEVQSGLAQARQGEELAQEGLALILGLDTGVRIKAKTKLRPAELEHRPGEWYIEQGLKKNFDLKLLDLGLDAKKKELDLKESSFYPNFGFGLDMGFAYAPGQGDTGFCDPSNPFVCDPYNYFYVAPALGLRWNIDLAGNIHQYRQVEAELGSISAKRSLARKVMGLKLSESHRKVATLKKQMKYRRSGMKQAKRLLVAHTMDYNMGIGETKDLLDALGNWIKSRIVYYQTVHDYNVAISELEIATGSVPGMGNE